MIIDINFFNGGINKYRRNRSLKIKEDDITISKTMFLDGYNLFDLAKKLKLVDLVEEISYQEYSRGNQLNKEGSTVFWYNPPRKFPEKTFNGKPVKFLCPFCENNDNGIGHKDSCVLQKKFLLICHPTWVEQNRQDLENSNLIERKTTYSYKNPIDETDHIKWGYKTIWYGRRSRDYKCHPENLNIDNSNVKKNSDDNDEKSFESTHSTMGI